jgi:alpha-tubulin suppressor-like RCC1 family protein
MIKHFQMIEHLPSHLTAISAGSMHTAILDSSGGIYLFGDNRYDQLNQRAHSNLFTPFYSDQFKKYHILNIVCGGCQTIIFAQRKSIISMC